MRRRTIAALLAGTVVVSSASGWVASSRIRSPAEVAARTAPPTASAILVPAEMRTLSTDIVTRGTARFGAPQQLSLAPSTLNADPAIITSVPLPGSALAEGDIALTASGRPAFLLTGQVPMFRDLGPGLEGDDVRQLEEALARLGFAPGPADGRYDSGTERAVSAWYRAAGFSPTTTTPSQLAAIRTLETELAAGRLDILSARSSVASAEADLVATNAAVARATAVNGAAGGSVAAARAEADAGNLRAQAEVDALRELLDALRTGTPGTPSEIARATSNLDVAVASREATRLAGDHLVATAEADRIGAGGDVEAARAAAAAADLALANTKAGLSIRDVPTNLLQLEVGLAKRQAGVQVPADELIFVSSAPIRVAEVTAALGSPAVGPIMTATNSLVAIDSSLPLKEAPLVKPDMAVTIDEAQLGIKATGVITRVADTPGTNGVDGFHIYVEIAVDAAPPNLVGASVRLTVPIKSTGGAVLAVPVAAVSLAADGTSQVVRDVNGARAPLVVEPGVSANGFVAVVSTAGDLKAGDLVVAGIEAPVATPASVPAPTPASTPTSAPAPGG